MYFQIGLEIIKYVFLNDRNSNCPSFIGTLISYTDFSDNYLSYAIMVI